VSYLLDTNIVSEGIKPAPQPAVEAWFTAQNDGDLFMSAVSLGEIKRGILELPAGRRRQTLDQWYAGPDGPRLAFAGRILPFDDRVAEVWGEIIAEGRKKGQPRSPIDMMIAATARVHRLTVVSLNDRDFNGVVACFNPLRA
jgi:predicted nucleic acid-binding protein